MTAHVTIFGIDQEISFGRHTSSTTIRKEQRRGKVTLGKDSLAWFAAIERDDGTGETFHITEADFKALGG